MDEHNVAYTYIRIISSHKKEWSSDTRYDIDKPWKYDVKLNTPGAKGPILHDSTYMGYLEEASSQRQKADYRCFLWGMGSSYWLQRLQSLFRAMEKFWK